MPFWTVHILALQNTKLPDLLVANLHYRNWSKRSTFLPPHVLFYLISLQACWEPLTASWARILSTSTWSSPSPPSPPHKTSSSSMEYVTELVSEGSPLAWLTSSSRVEKKKTRICRGFEQVCKLQATWKRLQLLYYEPRIPQLIFRFIKWKKILL